MAKVLVNFKDDFLQEIDKIAEFEHRTRSSLIREALRRYLSGFKTDTVQKENPEQLKPIVANKIIYPATKAS